MKENNQPGRLSEVHVEQSDTALPMIVPALVVQTVRRNDLGVAQPCQVDSC